MAFKLGTLPYGFRALEPHISEETMRVHRNRHHEGYVSKLNRAIEDTQYEGRELTQIITDSATKQDDASVFNNGAQVWNHSFYFASMSPEGGGRPDGGIGTEIDRAFGDLDRFHEAFRAAATGRFGSGYAWVVWNGEKVEVMSTPNAEPPFIHDKWPILGADVWEHAYYLDYLNKRAAYVDAFLNHLINWKFANQQLRLVEDHSPIDASEVEKIESSLVVG
ncbi:MAG: superoxide dismutase [Alphaproteobacteria bacterium]|jgi:Fe-Mn family superoxide dismutase